MRLVGALPILCVLAPGCVLEAATAGTADPVATVNEAGTPSQAAPSADVTWPDEDAFRRTAEGLARPWTLTRARATDGTAVLAFARKQGDGWILGDLIGGEALPEGCAELPCAWPASLVPERPLAEAAALPPGLADAVAYADTLVGFEGPLSLPGDDEATDWVSSLPDAAWSEPASVELAPFLERLRRYHPMGGCSMDTAPQSAARMRAVAAAQSGRTGLAVQGWLETVGYWSSARVAWSSYGQSHPDDHLTLLQTVGVDPARFLLGVIVALPEREPRLALADIRRVAPDLGPAFLASLRAWARDPAVDPYDRALLLASVASIPIAEDPDYAQLPEESRALLDHWSR